MTDRHTLASLNRRVEALEAIAGDIGKIKGLIKLWAPIAVTAAISSGLVNGQVGSFLRALIVGSPT